MGSLTALLLIEFKVFFDQAVLEAVAVNWQLIYQFQAGLLGLATAFLFLNCVFSHTVSLACHTHAVKLQISSCFLFQYFF